jgi:hypothetical protein
MWELFGGVEKKHPKPLKGLLLLVEIQTLTYLSEGRYYDASCRFTKHLHFFNYWV